jgi:ABC-type multidrug transport system ATPase subunit
MKIGFVYNNELIKKIKLEEGSNFELMIGRSEQANIILPVTVVSNYHAQLIKDANNNLYLIDQNSTNGTFINKQKINPGVPYEITVRDQITLSNTNGVSIVFNPDVYKPGSINAPPSDVHVDTKANTNLFSKLKEKGVVYIGRGSEADIILDHPTISRLHAMIEKKGEHGYIIKDLGSTNGTFLNGSRISGTTSFTEQDIIFIGRFKLTLNGSAKDLSNEIAIRADRIGKVFPNEKVGLFETTFDVQSNILMAVMGPSGCGKSTLLKALNGASPATSGSVYICGLELTQHYDYLKTQIGYVPQDDIVHSELTVEQSLWYAAKLRLQNLSEEQINDKINQVLDNLKIQHIRDQLVGKISGGQRKRVSIAVEILNNPMILFLDEPTSPLDPQTIEDFLVSLRKLCEMGTTVILVTHKPEDLNYVDSVIFMAEGGHMVYYGNSKNYLNYFEVADAVKVYSNLAGEKAKRWIGKYNSNKTSSNPHEQTIKQIRASSKTNYFSQYLWLTRRYFNIKLNDKLNSAIMIVQAPVIAFLVCMIYDKIELSVPFLLTVSAVWFGANNAAREIVGELPIYMRERMFNQGIFPYILSKITVLGTFAAVQSLLFTLILCGVYHVDSDTSVSWGNPMMTFLWMLTLSVASTLLGLLLSATVSTTEKVMTVVPIALIPQIMLAGIVAKISTAHVELLSYLTLSRWGTEGFCNIQEKVMLSMPMTNPTTGNTSDTLSKVKAIEQLKKSFHPENYENTFGKMHGHLKLDFIAVATLGLIFFICICIALKKKDTIKINQ